MASDPQSLSNLYQDVDDIAESLSVVVYGITQDARFVNGNFASHNLQLSEAFCLMWQNADTGQVDGRMVGLPLKVCVYACMFIDLCALRRITIELNDGGDLIVHVESPEQTSTFLDSALFDHILKTCSKSRGTRREGRLVKLLACAAEADAVNNVFDSLIAKGVLSEKVSGLGLFKKFPTIDPVPELELEEELRRVATRAVTADAYMLALVALAREADRIFLSYDPILRKHFPVNEYEAAKRTLDEIIQDVVPL